MGLLHQTHIFTLEHYNLQKLHSTTKPNQTTFIMSGIINKVKDALHHNNTSALSGSTNHGPHDSNAANKVDPRIDSDRDGRAAHGTGLGSSNTHSTGLGSSNTHSTGLGSNTHGTTGAYGSNTTAGPHSSNVANKVDPRVDSDLDGSNRVGAGNTGYGASNTHSTGLGSSNTHSTGLGSSNTHGTTGAYGSNTTGTTAHNSSMANKLDPRVDSTTGTTGTTGYSGTHAGNHSGT